MKTRFFTTNMGLRAILIYVFVQIKNFLQYLNIFGPREASNNEALTVEELLTKGNTINSFKN